MSLRSGRRIFPLFVLPLVFLAAAIGCKNSAKTSAPPAASPTQATQLQSLPQPSATAVPVKAVDPGKPPADTPPLPPLAAMVPTKTYEVKVPASFDLDDVRKDTAVEFLVAGEAGRFLRVRVSEIYRVLVRPPGDGSRPLEVGGDSKGNWFYALPQTGTYRILYAPQETPSEIGFDFLASDDPITDPGVKPDQFAIEFGDFAGKRQIAVVPYALNEDEDYQNSWPTHLALANEHFEFRIMTVPGNKGVFKEYERITALENDLHSRGRDAVPKNLPYPVYGDGGLNLWTRPEFIQGPGWRGLRWIAGFAQDISCAREMGGQQLGYYFEGISNDGRLFILLRAHVSSPALTQQFGKDCASAEAKDRNADPNAVFQKEMIGIDPSSFQPNLDQLDAVIRSLKLIR